MEQQTTKPIFWETEVGMALGHLIHETNRFTSNLGFVTEKSDADTKKQVNTIIKGIREVVDRTYEKIKKHEGY